MPVKRASRTIQEINQRIQEGKVVVVTAQEMTEIVKRKGPGKAFREVDVVTTGTFSPMCSSGAFINFGHTKPATKAAKVWLNDVPAYAGVAAVDVYIGATEPAEDDPLNRVHPGQFKYGGGHVLHDLVAGKTVRLRATAYGTDCYPNRKVNKKVKLSDLPYAVLLNPRNAYQNYNCAVNLSNKTIYTYMGVLKPKAGNANYSTAGQLSPLMNDPYYLTLGPGDENLPGRSAGIHPRPRKSTQAECPERKKRRSSFPCGHPDGDGEPEGDEPKVVSWGQHARVRLFPGNGHRSPYSGVKRGNRTVYRSVGRGDFHPDYRLWKRLPKGRRDEPRPGELR